LRSSREKEDVKLLRRLRTLDGLIETGDASEEEVEEFRSERRAIQEEFAKRNVEVYGAITLRTDGRHLAVAFRLERERHGSSPKRWQTYWFYHDGARGFVPEEADRH
jgi:hypothetical protein